MLAKHSRAVPWAILGLIAFAALGAYLRFVSGAPFGIDEWAYGAAGVTRGSVAYAIAVFMAKVGGGVGSIACSVIAVALLFAIRKPRDAMTVVTAMTLGIALSQLTKFLVLRDRPWDPLYTSTHSSFPSGHTMGAAALAVSLALVVAGSDSLHQSATRWAWIIAVAWVVVMAWSRVALRVHWLSDTLAGALLGVCAAVLARHLCTEKQGRVTRTKATAKRASH